MNNWNIITDDALNSTGWFLWSRSDSVIGTVYQMTSNKELTPKSKAGFLTVESLFKTYGVKLTASNPVTIH
jgi:hypothetical protein